jgi:hypothetical protein
MYRNVRRLTDAALASPHLVDDGRKRIADELRALVDLMFALRSPQSPATVAMSGG